MIFDDWATHKKETLQKRLFWEYDTTSPKWDLWDMRYIVVERVLELGWESDYYAMFQIYGGIDKVREIVKELPYLEPREIAWACVLFDLKKEELRCYTRKQSRRALLTSLKI